MVTSGKHFISRCVLCASSTHRHTRARFFLSTPHSISHRQQPPENCIMVTCLVLIFWALDLTGSPLAKNGQLLRDCFAAHVHQHALCSNVWAESGDGLTCTGVRVRKGMPAAQSLRKRPNTAVCCFQSHQLAAHAQESSETVSKSSR